MPQTTTVMPEGRQRYFNNDGTPCAGGLLYTYAAGTSTPKATYSDADGTTPNPNPVPLDAHGEAVVYWSGAYKVDLKQADGQQVTGYPVDNLRTDPAGIWGVAGTILAQLAAAAGATLLGWGRGLAGIIPTTLAKWLGWHTPIIFEFMTDAQIAAVKAGTATDVTAAVQAAMNTCDGAIFPRGTYPCAKLSVTRDFAFYGKKGAKLLHKAGTAGNNAGLIENLIDAELVLEGMEVDGNIANQNAPVGYFNLIWTAIGSMKIRKCYIHDSQGHLIRTGNIDNYVAGKFAHDIVIEHNKVVNPRTANSSGDCIRIERTVDALVAHNFVDGGLSSIRTQLYCKRLRFYDNDSGYSWADTGITVAMSEDLEIIDNYCHHHFNNGIEVDAVVNCLVQGNTQYKNGNCGILAGQYGAAGYTDEPRFSGSIADGYDDYYTGAGYSYSNQVRASGQVPNINTRFIGNSSIDNASPDRLIGLRTDLYQGNYLANSNVTVGGYHCQLSIEGGTLNNTAVRVQDNTFVPGPNDTAAIGMQNYQFTAHVAGNRVVGNKPLGTYAAVGMRDLNNGNRFLADPTKRAALLADVADATSMTGAAISHTTTGAQTYGFTGIYGSAQGEKLLRVVARVAAGTQAATLDVNLYNSAGAYVATIMGNANIQLTTAYKEFVIRIPPAASNVVGCDLRPQLSIGAAGVTVFFQELNVFTSAA